jgi:hypothetical protein
MTITVTVNYTYHPCAVGETPEDCTMQWWEKANKATADYPAAGIWEDMFAAGSSDVNVQWGNHPTADPPNCKGTFSIPLVDKVCIQGNKAPYDYYLCQHIMLLDGSGCRCGDGPLFDAEADDQIEIYCGYIKNDYYFNSPPPKGNTYCVFPNNGGNT